MAVTPADKDEAFLREVDENLRADQMAAFGRRWGKWIVAAVVAGLAVLAGVLWWQNRQQGVASADGEKLQTAFDNIATGRFAPAARPLSELASSPADGFRVAALLSQAAVAAEKNDIRTAAAKLASVAGDAGLAKPYRNLALVKQTMLEFDTVAPQAVIDRMKPLAVAGNAFHGSAGELIALAQLKQGRRADAGRTFGAMAKDPTVPDSIRQRAVQMAGVLGVDAVDQAGSGTGK